MKFCALFITSAWCILSCSQIKQSSAQSSNLNSSLDLCAFRKSKTTCLCGHRTDPNNNIPVFKADCAWMSLQEFPRDTQLKNVQDLDLSHNAISTLDSYKNNFESLTLVSIKLPFNKITHVEQDFFKNTPNLIELDLSHNALVKLPNSNVFRGLAKLQVLNLGFNNIPTLPDGVFTSLSNLKELDLGHNYLGALVMGQKNVFKSGLGLPSDLKTLKLDGLAITSLHYTFFDGATEMKHLSMADNPMQELPALPYTLDFLDLSGTDLRTLSPRLFNYHSLKVLKLNRLKKLEKVENYAFYNLQALEELYLSDCKGLKEFNELAFGYITNGMDLSLKKISLARSGLKSLNSTFLLLFNKMEHVDLRNNPWVCNCDILWLQELNGSLYREDSSRCLSPFYVANKEIMMLTEKDLPGCVENENYYQRVLLSILGCLVAILMILIFYLLYLGPFYHTNKYKGIGPGSPYQGNTIGIIPARAENLD